MTPGSAGLLAVMDEKSLVPLCPVGVCVWGGGAVAVVTND